MKKSYLAFDLGASSGRAILGGLEDKKLTLTEIHRFDNGPLERDGSLFWDFDALFNEIKEGLKKATSGGNEISGIGIDTWGVDYLLLKNDGSFARLPYNYRDSRTDNIPDELFQVISPEHLYSKTGIQLMQLNTIYQLYAHKKAHPEDLEDSKLLLMPDALTYMLCGKIACEYSEASTTNLLDAEKRNWDFELIETLGLPRSMFPEIVNPCSSAGVLKDDLCKQIGCAAIPVYHIGSHDTASAVASVPASTDTNWAYLSCGTWALLGAEIDSPVLTEEARLANFTNEGGLNRKIRFLTNIMGMWLIQECRRIWKEEGNNVSFGEMEKMAVDAEPLKFLLNLNHQTFFAPGDMPTRIREYCQNNNQGEIKDAASIVRCVYDSLALCFRDRLEAMQKIQNVEYNCLHIVGGGTQAKLLMQLSADCIGIPVKAGPVEATAVGNLLGQAMASGDVESLEHAREIVRNSFEVEEYLPSTEKSSEWDNALTKFIALP
jgi:rhamnulokinase